MLLTACSSGEEPVAEAAPDNDEAAPDPEDAARTEPITVTMVDFGYENLPASVPVGTTLEVANAAEVELHELVAFRLADDDDRAVTDLLDLTPPELVGALGEPTMVLLAEPDGPQIPAVGDGTLTEPGRYAVLCFIPTGVEPGVYLRAAAETDEGPPQVEGGPPHFVHGMHAELIVE